MPVTLIWEVEAGDARILGYSGSCESVSLNISPCLGDGAVCVVLAKARGLITSIWKSKILGMMIIRALGKLRWEDWCDCKGQPRLI